MSKKQMTLVYYYIPQDNDDPETLNVFGVIQHKNNIRLQHIYDQFPLNGSYIFRFKVMHDNVVAWLDLSDFEANLPTFKGRIIIKVTRISWETNKDDPYGHYRFYKKPQIMTFPKSPSNKQQIHNSQSQRETVTQSGITTKAETDDLLNNTKETVGFSMNSPRTLNKGKPHQNSAQLI